MQELRVKSLLPVRLDKYLMQQYPALGLGRLNKALRENKIKLNGKKVPLSTRVQNGDLIRIYLLDEQLGLTAAQGPLFLQARALPKSCMKTRTFSSSTSRPALRWMVMRPTPCSTVCCVGCTRRSDMIRKRFRGCVIDWIPGPAGWFSSPKMQRQNSF